MRNRLLYFTAIAAALLVSCKEDPGEKEVPGGPVINEISFRGDLGKIAVVEILNTSSSSIDLTGYTLSIASGAESRSISFTKTLGGFKRLLVKSGTDYSELSINGQVRVTLLKGDETVDSFESDGTVPARFGSWQRIPDGKGEWEKFTYSSPGQENSVMSLDNTHHIAFWSWGASIEDLLAKNASQLRKLKSKGYDHVLLNSFAFEPENADKGRRFIIAADEAGIAVHAWIQCFYDGEWVSPVDDANVCYVESIYSRIREEARSCIEDWGCRGVHLDYIRFGGTAYKHNPSEEVNAVGAVDLACSQVRQIGDSFNEGIIISAALMGEMNSTYYYGQEPSHMARYVHVLMPMIYRYSYGYDDTKCKQVSDWFATEAAKGGGVSWAGMTSYKANTTPMSEQEILKDAKVFANSKADGVVLFRYSIGTFPDMKDLW